MAHFFKGVKEMYAVQTLPTCDHLQQVGPLPERGLHCEDPCEDCQNVGENWSCLICYKVRKTYEKTKKCVFEQV